MDRNHCKTATAVLLLFTIPSLHVFEQFALKFGDTLSGPFDGRDLHGKDCYHS
jgi:hypothetical protein